MLRDIVLSVNPKAEEYFKNKKYSFNQFCQALSQPNVAKALGCSSVTLTKWIKDLFPNKPTKGKLFNWILSQTNYKFCTNCKEYKLRTQFRLNSSMSDGLNNHCKMCHSINSSLSQPFRQATYRANKTNQTPKWANLNSIKQMYNNCPKGYHVDHIIPLNGKEVSGLHVENNLQYLLSIDNIKKGNKMVV